jgi:hypothetical protein
VARKPSEEVTKEDAAKVQHYEVRCKPSWLSCPYGIGLTECAHNSGSCSRTPTRKGLVRGRSAGHCRAQRSEAQ